MTKEELEKEAGEYADMHAFRVPYDGSNKFYDDVDFKASKEGYLAGAEPREKHIAELEAQIEKMKCCENCQTVRDAEGNCYLLKDGKCKNKDKWELRR